MQELVGRLTVLDPAASETLRAITYFDALVGAGASVDALLRAAAVMSGVSAGAQILGRVHRYASDGKRLDSSVAASHPIRRTTSNGEVWLERVGEPHFNDEMIIERLALTIDLAHARHQPESALAIAIDGDRPLTHRHAALARLRLDPDARVRVLALPLDTEESGSIEVATSAGLMRAVLDGGSRQIPSPAGVGVWVRADTLPNSWDAALIALRLSHVECPIVDASTLGSFLLLVRAYDPVSPPQDVRSVAALDSRTFEVLRALVRAESVRAASVMLDMHHSTVQARHRELTVKLGFDPRSAFGRARVIAAEMLLRFAPPV
jgi:hypothetical protein